MYGVDFAQDEVPPSPLFYLIFRVTQGNIMAYDNVRRMPVYKVYAWINQMILDNRAEHEKPAPVGLPLRTMEPLRNS